MLRVLPQSAAGLVLVSCAWLIEPQAAQRTAPTVAQKGYVEKIPGTRVSFEMVPIAGGTFRMGSPPREAGRKDDEGPAHLVTVGPFWIGKFEVTWDEYDLFAFGQKLEAPPGALPPAGADAVSRPTPPYGDESFGFGKGRQPAINMAHHSAMEYTRWLSSRSGKTYRLPTEAEWEFSARAGSTTAYSYGDDPRKLGDYAWYEKNSNRQPHQVGTRKPNAWGLHDMHGNVAEWCLDQYDDDFYERFDPERPIIGPVLLPDERRFPHVARGGSWQDDAARLRSAARRGSEEDWSQRDPQSPRSIWWHTDAQLVGLRVVRAVKEQAELKNLRSKITRESQ